MLKVTKWLVYSLATTLLVMLLVAGITLSLVLEDKPWVEEDLAGQLEHADEVRPLLGQLSGLLRHSRYQQFVQLSRPQLQSLAGLAQRAESRLQGQIGLSDELGWMVWSYRLPDNPFGDYLNVSAELLPHKGLRLGTLKLGSVSMPGERVLTALLWLLDWKMGEQLASDFSQRIEQVHLSDEKLLIRLAPFDDLVAKLKALPKSNLSEDKELRRQRVQYYLAQLQQMPLPNADVSLGRLIGYVFNKAQQRTHSGAEASEENEAALMALAIFAGSYRFAHLVGDLAGENGKIQMVATHTTLAQRRDLSLHFLYSAAIKLFSEQGISVAIGEFKELMDRAKKGSGFSFVDLAADMTGIRFAELATDPQTAERLQQTLAGLDSELLFFPSIDGLPEGFDKQAFKHRYQQVDSEAYKAELQEIQRRIGELALYQG
ncbi:hypothetical protein [Bowmanella pacifica]|uniref:Uncharacterized protein n=2 Tax=Bowmanella TaxID=366580 RepID=A0A918DFG5_9ALTE|nr:hypothetical protein [Bowmanella pacifica]GGO63946.1 hypothetical protein GCM10010982_02190 [Bowmanella pacifica]